MAAPVIVYLLCVGLALATIVLWLCSQIRELQDDLADMGKSRREWQQLYYQTNAECDVLRKAGSARVDEQTTRELQIQALKAQLDELIEERGRLLKASEAALADRVSDHKVQQQQVQALKGHVVVLDAELKTARGHAAMLEKRIIQARNVDAELREVLFEQ